MTDPGLFLGLISGTSRDGVDAALVRFRDARPEVVAARCTPYPVELSEALASMAESGRRPGASALADLDAPVARHFAESALGLLRQAGAAPGSVRALGSHGQTVWHAPGAPRPESIQLGNPAAIARLTGITTVGDFRRADIEAGGQGAPLAPLLHRALFRPREGARVVLNLGGIANISVLQADGSVSGFDTGPANCLMDAWIRKHRQLSFDRDGAWASGGTLREDLLQALLDDPYFRLPPPKSTGTEYFNLDWIGRRWPARPFEPRDIQRTLAELSAITVAGAIRPAGASEVLVCGGGAHNPFLLGRIAAHLGDVPLRSTAEAGLDPDWVEAVLFAWLARERVAGRPQDTRAITGAREPVLLGSVHDGTGLS